MPERSTTNRTLFIVFVVVAIALALFIGALFAKVASNNEPAQVLPAASASDTSTTVELEPGSTTVVETRTIHVCDIGDGFGISHLAVEEDGSCDTARQYFSALSAGHQPDEDIIAEEAVDRPECTPHGTARVRCETDDGTVVWLWNEAKRG